MAEKLSGNSENTQKKHRGAPPERLWKKGQSGNPKGKPKGTVSITSAIKAELLKIPSEQRKTWLELTVKRIMSKATGEGDVRMLKTLWAYVDGLPKQSMDLDIGLKPDLQELAESIQQIANEQITRTGKKTI